jgi:hypothetical protein
MAATTTINRGTRRWQRVVHAMRRMTLGVGSLVLGIGSRWDAFVDSGQLGPSPDQYISRHTGGRI